MPNLNRICFVVVELLHVHLVMAHANHFGGDDSSLLHFRRPFEWDSDGGGNGGADCADNMAEQTLLMLNWSENTSAAPCSQECLEKQIGRRTSSTDKPVYVYVHVPKTAGISFLKDAQQILGKIQMVHNGEQCFDSSIAIWHDNTVFAMMFRSPLGHVLSQFLHCKIWAAAKKLEIFPNGPGVYGGFLG